MTWSQLYEVIDMFSTRLYAKEPLASKNITFRENDHINTNPIRLVCLGTAATPPGEMK